MPRLSPTRTTSVPAMSTSCAKLASYAVRHAIGSRASRISRNVPTLTGGDSMPRCCNCLYISTSASRPERPLGQRHAGRIEEMAAVLHAQDRLQQVLIVGFAVNRVNGRRIDDEQRCRIEVIEKTGVSVAEPLEVLGL